MTFPAKLKNYLKIVQYRVLAICEKSHQTSKQVYGQVFFRKEASEYNDPYVITKKFSREATISQLLFR